MLDELGSVVEVVFVTSSSQLSIVTPKDKREKKKDSLWRRNNNNNGNTVFRFLLPFGKMSGDKEAGEQRRLAKHIRSQHFCNDRKVQQEIRRAAVKKKAAVRRLKKLIQTE